MNFVRLKIVLLFSNGPVLPKGNFLRKVEYFDLNNLFRNRFWTKIIIVTYFKYEIPYHLKGNDEDSTENLYVTTTDKKIKKNAESAKVGEKFEVKMGK